MNTPESIVYCSGPYWAPEEVQNLSEIARTLERAGFRTYLPHRDGIESLYSPWCGNLPAPHGAEMNALLQRAVFALEVYQIVGRCHALVFNMNGRAPDEGGVFKTALAFATGSPLVIYKNDNRSTFHGNDNSMVTGLAPAFATINRTGKLPAELTKAFKWLSAAGERPIAAPAHLRATLDLGHKLWDLVEAHRAAGAEALREQIVALHDELVRIPHEGAVRHTASHIVYCSGPLFCPEEFGVMADIAQILEDAGYRTFLPQRDGVEAFVMNQVDAPLANAWIFKPIQTLINKAVFALDIYQIVERCDCFVFNMNGRVPDEGGVVETAVAFACGKPLVIYRNDLRSLAGGQPHPMLMAAAQAVVDDIRQIPAALARIAADQKAARAIPAALPPQVRRTVAFGRRVWKLLRLIRFLKPRNALLT